MIISRRQLYPTHSPTTSSESSMLKTFPIAFVLLLLGASIYNFVREQAFVEGFVEAQGKIVAIRSERISRGDGRQYSSDVHAVVEYPLNGEHYRFESQFFGVPAWREGQSVTALVSQTSPNIGRIKRVDDIYPRSAGLGVLAALALLAMATGRFLRQHRHRSAVA